MNEQHNANQIAALNEQIASLKSELNKAYVEISEYAEKRDKLNEKFRKHRENIQSLKSERNQLNDTVRALKQQRDAARERKKVIIEEIKEVTKKVAELKAKKPKKSRWQLEKEIRDIEWKIQTTSLDLQEEKKLVEEARQLEPQLNIYQKIDQQNMKIAALRQELEALQAKANASHQELIANVQKSQELHARIIAKIKEADEIKKEAALMHSTYVQAKERIKSLQQALKALIEQKTQLQNAIREENEMQRKTAEKMLKKKLEVQARSKLQCGEKLSWEEFQLLAADDSEEDQPTQD
ncbi:MAG: hypothetical protein QXD19_05885 [Candidatus Bathyarchaeia archaeon]